MTKINVTTMSCGHCVSKISNELLKLDTEVTVDLPTRTVSIADDSKAELAKQLIIDLGYEIG